MRVQGCGSPGRLQKGFRSNRIFLLLLPMAAQKDGRDCNEINPYRICEICLTAYEIRFEYEILALWANMMVLADANIPIRLPHPRSGPINGGESLFA